MTSTGYNSLTSGYDSLTTLFPTVEGLFSYLRSPAGGLHTVIEEGDDGLALIHYDKRFSTVRGSLRSIVWNKTTNKPICVSPGYGHKFSVAIDRCLEPGSFTVEEFVDGVMINQFHDGTRWRLASHTQIDATTSFFGKRPFAELFNETFTSLGLTTDLLTPGVSYSWVLQHPEERVVVAPAYGIPTLTLVSTYPTVAAETLGPMLATFQVAKYDLTTLEEVKNFVEAEGRRRRHLFKGVVLKTADGERYKLRSNEYDAVRFLRGNQAKRPFTWLSLWSAGQLPTYLRFYPEEQCDADAVIAKFKEITQEAHTMYLKVYRQRELPLGQAPQKFRKLLWDAHKAGKGAYFPNMRLFMNELDTARKLWLINYEVRYGAPETTSSAGQADVGYGTPTVAEENQENQEIQENPLVEEVKMDA